MFVGLKPAYLLYIKDFLDVSFKLDNAIILIDNSLKSTISHEFLYVTLLKIKNQVIIYDLNNTLKTIFYHSIQKRVGILNNF